MIAKNIFGNKPYLIKTYIDWAALQKFQEQLAKEKHISLSEKYDYLQNCRLFPVF